MLLLLFVYRNYLFRLNLSNLSLIQVSIIDFFTTVLLHTLELIRAMKRTLKHTSEHTREAVVSTYV